MVFLCVSKEKKNNAMSSLSVSWPYSHNALSLGLKINCCGIWCPFPVSPAALAKLQIAAADWSHPGLPCSCLTQPSMLPTGRTRHSLSSAGPLSTCQSTGEQSCTPVSGWQDMVISLPLVFPSLGRFPLGMQHEARQPSSFLG